MTILTINEQRFLRDLHALADIGLLPPQKGGGRDRRAFSQAEREARSLFTRLAEEARLDVRTDPAGNLSARHAAAPHARTLLFGSHMDTVPNGGPYDGALGTIAALEAIRVLMESGAQLPVSLECIAFTDEEGRYCGLTGSQLFAGAYSSEATQRFVDAAMRFPEDVAAISSLLPGPFTVENVLKARRPVEELAGFVELHIEQGPQLEHEGVQIGVVDAIFGRASRTVTLIGRSDHAGTTPMNLRQDALVAASRFITHMHDYVRFECLGTVLTCGDVRVKPGADNVVPNEAAVLVEYRANASVLLNKIEAELERTLSDKDVIEECTVQVANQHRVEPCQMNQRIQAMIRKSCEALGYVNMRISSGALHDAHSLAAVTPAGMIFVPSVAGRSHCPEEMTSDIDLIAGANVLLNTIYALANSY